MMMQAYLRWKHSDKRCVVSEKVLPSGIIEVVTLNNAGSEDRYYEYILPYIMNMKIEDNLLTR